MFSFFPKNPEFQPKYHKTVVIIQRMASVFYELQYDWKNRAEYRKQAEAIEEEGDAVIHDIIVSLDNAFITPFDREDMYILADSLDSIADDLLRLIIHCDIYRLDASRPYMPEFGSIYMETANVLEKVIRHLFEKKDGDSTQKLLILMGMLGKKAETYYEDSVRLLFEEERNVIEVIKWEKILYEMYMIMRNFKKSVRVVEGILMKIG